MTSAVPQGDFRQFQEIGDAVCERLRKNERVRRNLPGDGRLRMDRQLPFLCIYRRPASEDIGTNRLVTSEAAYLVASGEPRYRRGLRHLCQSVQAIMQEHFGRFLFLEIWSQQRNQDNDWPPLQPAFEIFHGGEEDLAGTVEVLADALSEVKVTYHPAKVTVQVSERISPPGLEPLRLSGASGENCFALGIAVRPVYRDVSGETLFPLVLQTLRPQLARAIRKAVAEFAGLARAGNGRHYESLGPSAMVKAARLVDQQLCEVAEAFDFLLQATPTNTDQAWQSFEQGGYREEPVFSYRPLPYDPNLLKRRLFEIEIEHIEDATLSQLCWEKQVDLDRKLTALRALNTPEFLYTSLQLYGHADDSLLELAHTILDWYPTQEPPADGEERLGAKAVAAHAREEIDHYHERLPEFNATVEICGHIAAGLMVSQDKLLIAESLQLPSYRLEPLMHHEVGTHLVTYFNGRCQPFRQLYAGLAGYEELQEGLAVLAEQLTGGLTVNRLRVLAGRVIAARMMTESYSFPETFDRLHGEFGFEARQAFVTTLRVFRGGGLTKDVIYLRGLRNVLSYLSKGHDIEPLYVGKIGLHHVPSIQEMRRRDVIKPPGVLPRFWKDPDLRARLEECRGLSVSELIERKL